MNIVRRNPWRSAAAVIFTVAIISLIVWIVTRESPADSQPVTDGPMITITGISRISNPLNDDSEQVEGYIMGGVEYAVGDVVTALGKNIDIKVSWKNGAGFSQKKVTELIIERYINDTSVQRISKTDPSLIKDFGGGEITFDGDTLTDAHAEIVGDPSTNKIVFSYKSGESTAEAITSTNTFTIPQSEIDGIPNLSNTAETSIDPSIFSDGVSSEFVSDSFTYIHLSSRSPGYSRNMRVRQNADASVSFTVKDAVIEIVTGVEKYKIEKYLDEQYVLKDAIDDAYVIWDADSSSTSKTSNSIFSSSAALTRATWNIETLSRDRSKYIQSVIYKCNQNESVDVTDWFKKFIDETEPGDDLSKYLCSAGGKYEGKCGSGNYPGSHNVFSDSGLYTAAINAGSGGGNCPSQPHGVTITGVNGATTYWSWGQHLNLSHILSTRVVPSVYIKSATYKCGGWHTTDITEGIKTFLDDHAGSSDLSRFLCGPGGKYTSSCSNSGGYPGYQYGTALGKMLAKLRVPKDNDGGDDCTHSKLIGITGINGATTYWSWGSYLDLSGIMTSEIPPSKYVKSATYKCGGWHTTDITEGIKTFLDDHAGSSDLSRFLCGPGGKYTSSCSNSGGYPGYQYGTALGKMLAKLRVPKDNDGGDDCTHSKLIGITGVNDATTYWGWGSYLDLSGIMKGNPLSAEETTLLNKVKSIESAARALKSP